MRTTRVVTAVLLTALLVGVQGDVCAQSDEPPPEIVLDEPVEPAALEPADESIPWESVEEETLAGEAATTGTAVEAAEPVGAWGDEEFLDEEPTGPAAGPVIELPGETGVEPAIESVTPEVAPATELIELDAEGQLPEGADLSRGEEGTELITITLDNVPLQDVVRMFTRISGANIVAGTNLQGNVTVSLQNVEWKPAMQVILDSVNMALVEKRPGIYSVMSKAELAAEPVTMDTVYLRFATVSNVVPIVQKMLVTSNSSVAGFAAANAIVVQETAARLTTIKDVITRIDKPRPQVLIEAKFVELNDKAIKDLGINWQVLEGYSMSLKPSWQYASQRSTYNNVQDSTYDYGSHQRSEGSSEFDQENENYIRYNNTWGSYQDDYVSSLGTVPNIPTINYGGNSWNQNYSGVNTDPSGGVTPSYSDSSSEQSYSQEDSTLGQQRDRGTLRDITKQSASLFSAVLNADEFGVTLSALKQNEGVSIISNPKVLVASGETAAIHVGLNTPNVTVQIDTETKEKSYTLDSRQRFIETGVKVDVTPVVNTDSNISVRIIPELSRIVRRVAAGDGTITFPETSTRKVVTDFSLENGRTAAIGGLTTAEDRETVKKVPLLGDIPIIGKYLFRHTHTEKSQDEVIIFVTVALANPESLSAGAGIPTEGRLIHRHLVREATRGSAVSGAHAE